MNAAAHSAVIFDMDGVLVDSYRAHWESWRISCDGRGIEITPEHYATLFGRSFRAFAEALSDPCPGDEEVARWCEEKEGLYRELIEADFPEMPGASALIRALDDAGFVVGVASSGPRANVDCLLRHLGAASLLQATVSADDVRHAKPHPEPFLACAAALGVVPERCVVVEDSVHGLKGAEAAGMATVGLVGTCVAEELAVYADLVVRSLEALTPSVLHGLLPGAADGGA